MEKVLLSSVLALSAVASVSYVTKVPLSRATAPTTNVTKGNAANNHNNRLLCCFSIKRRKLLIL